MNSQPWLQHYDAGVPAHLNYPDQPLFRFLKQTARSYPDRACVIFEDQSISYRDMDALSDTLARGLVAIGIHKGEPVGLMMPNIPQFVLAFFAILKAGGVVVAINPAYKQREIEFQIRDSGVNTLITTSGSYDLINSLKPATRPDACIITSQKSSADLPNWIKEKNQNVLEEGEEILEGMRQGDLWMRDLINFYANDNGPLPAVLSTDPAIFQYTGGTTGNPKAALGLHRNLVANTLQFRAWLVSLEDGKETFLTALPLYHVYGMVIGMSVGIAMGASLVLVEDPRNVADVLQNIQKYRATFFPGVPRMYAAINSDPDVKSGKYNLQSIKACISGSAPLPRMVKEQFEALTGGKLVEGYGLSEAPTATHCNPIQGENRAGSVGLALPDVDCRIMDLEEGEQVLSPGQVGELVVRGPQVMWGYHEMPEETQLTLRNGWLYTGDIASMDEDGYVYLIDRKKELIKVGGFQVWPREIEEVIMLHPDVKEAAAAGIPDPDRGESIKAWVVLQPGKSVTEGEIQDWCRKQIAAYKVPDLVEFRQTLPRTNVGKLLRRELVRMHLESIR